MCYYFDDIIKFEDFDFGNILLDEKSYENISIFVISYKTSIGAKPLLFKLEEIDVFIRVYDGSKYLLYLTLKNIIRFMIRLDIL